MFCHFGLFFALSPHWRPRKPKFWKVEENTWRYYHLTHEHHKWQSYDVWFLRYGARRTESFVILGQFLPFYPTNNPQNQSFEKMKKITGDIIILQMHTINDNRMMYGSWHMECDEQNFLSLWTIFRPSTPLTTQKIKILKKRKKHPDISFYKSVPKIMIIYRTVTEIWRLADVVFVFHFGLFFALLPPSNPENEN